MRFVGAWMSCLFGFGSMWKHLGASSGRISISHVLNCLCPGEETMESRRQVRSSNRSQVLRGHSFALAPRVRPIMWCRIGSLCLAQHRFASISLAV